MLHFHASLSWLLNQTNETWSKEIPLFCAKLSRPGSLMGFVVILVTENTIANLHLPVVKENYIYSTFANMVMSH